MTVRLSKDQWHLVRYGTSAEQKYLLGEHLDTYDALVINANMVAYTPSALARFLGERAGNKPFLIDPQTHAFQHDLALLQVEDEDGAPAFEEDGRPRLKSSIRKLVSAYGEPLISCVSCGQALIPADFRDPGLTRAFAQRVGEFQIGLIRSHAADRGIEEYYRFADVTDPVTPLAVVAPYFYMDALTARHWLDVNRALVEATAEVFSTEHEVYAELVISKDILRSGEVFDLICRTYSDVPVSRVLLWIDEFKEHGLTPDVLARYAELVRKIGRPVVMLYGSFFSTCLMRLIPDSGLDGVCHGLEYGEDRAVIPAVGGLPVSRFYYPELHRRIRFADALRLARPHLTSPKDFRKNVCNCNMCREVIQEPAEETFALYGRSHPVTFKRRNQVVTLNYPDSDTRDLCVRHYMWNKHREFTDSGLTLRGVRRSLDEAAQRHARVLGLSETAHCSAWSEALGSLAKGPKQ